LRESRAALAQQQDILEKLNQENIRLLDELNANNSRLEHLLHHAISAQEAERKRLARELHDETGQSLTSILLRLKALQAETDPEVIHDRLNGLRYLTSQTLEEVRRLALDLRPMALDDLGLVPAIRWYVRQCAERNGIEIKLSVANTLQRLPADLEIVLYRAVQEGLTNIIRHAQAQHADVSLEQSGKAVWLTISDDGKGIQPSLNHRGGMGLEGMRERVMLVGGKFRLDSAPGAGTQIVIELPAGVESQ
jgi:signal transduction histidine kinase